MIAAMTANHDHLNKRCFGVPEPLHNSQVLRNLGTPDHREVLGLAGLVQVVLGLVEALVLPIPQTSQASELPIPNNQKTQVLDF